MFSYASISRRVAQRLGLAEDQTAAIVATTLRLRWRVRGVPGLAGVAAFVGWMVVFGKGTDLLEPGSIS